MKKITVIISFAVIAVFAASTLFAAGDSGKIWEEILKITEKCTDNVSYTMKTNSKIGGQAVSTNMKFYFKNVKNYRVDSDASGQKTRMVLTDKAAWVYIEAQNVVTNMEHSAIESIDIKASLEKQKSAADVSEGKDGANVTYTITERETKNKTVFTVDNKLGVFSKMQVYDGKGELLTEAVYGDWKFAKISDDTFKKPEGAKEMTMPAASATEKK